MTLDDSFKRPGAIPFKWEIRPGVPKIQHQPPPPPQQKQRIKEPPLSAPASPFIAQQQKKLGLSYLSPQEPRTRSFRSDPRARSERFRVSQPARIQPDIVSAGCFPSPLLRRKNGKRKVLVAPSVELETPSRRSFSSRKSIFYPSPSYGSPASSFRSSPRPVGESHWAEFGLF